MRDSGRRAAMRSLDLPRKPVVVAVNLAGAALHLLTGPGCHGPLRAFVTGYLIDLALPFALVLLLGLGLERSPTLRRPAVRASAVFLLGAVIEAMQYVGIPIFGRTADPIDLVMYAAGAIAAMVFEPMVLAPYPDANAVDRSGSA